MSDPKLDAVYSARSADEAERAYDAWASDYDADLMKMGYRLPWHFAATVIAHVPRVAPILDAGCGTGLQIEPLHLLGWRGVIGIDLSAGMLDVASAKGIYDDLMQAKLGERLPFETDQFAASFSVGTITPGHAPIETLDEMIRVTRPGGHLVFTLRHDAGQDPHYLRYPAMLEERGLIRTRLLTPEFVTMPLGEPSVRNAIHVCEVLA
jgi:predicted TPR repeat methyltransferase